MLQIVNWTDKSCLSSKNPELQRNMLNYMLAEGGSLLLTISSEMAEVTAAGKLVFKQDK